MIRLKFHYCCIFSGGPYFWSNKNCLREKSLTCFFWKKLLGICLPFPKSSDRLLNPNIVQNSFSRNFQGTGPSERFGNTANFSGDPGAKRRRTFYKSNVFFLLLFLFLSLSLSLSLSLITPIIKNKVRKVTRSTC